MDAIMAAAGGGVAGVKGWWGGGGGHRGVGGPRMGWEGGADGAENRTQMLGRWDLGRWNVFDVDENIRKVSYYQPITTPIIFWDIMTTS
jgi:hypothetical protein